MAITAMMALLTGVVARGQDTPRATVDFAIDIKPIFEIHCVHCHGPNKAEGFRIDDRDKTLGYLEPGDPQSSTLYEFLISDDPDELMPPPGDHNPLTREQIRTIRNWIRQGAEWPEDVEIVDPADALKPIVVDHGSLVYRLWLAIGAFHPAAAHLPIGLLMGAGLFALIGLRGNFVMGDCAYYCLWLGAITGVLASVVGWSYAISSGYGGDPSDVFDVNKSIFWHRLSGLVVSLLALLLAFFAAASRARDPDNGLLWKLGTLLIACAIGFVGYTGGKLQYGTKHYQQLNKIIDEWTGWNWSVNEARPEKPADSDNTDVGNVSSEKN
ncbi:MAG TPA: hypothetical protein PKD54_08100 [Pirellulaceae bacterium]|nr:hypothetical protein [Pirellulaceae bacterium]